MSLVMCQGEWLHGANGEAVCNGTLQIVDGIGPLGLPPLTYAEANQLLLPIALVFAGVFAFRILRRTF